MDEKIDRGIANTGEKQMRYEDFLLQLMGLCLF